MENKAMTLEQLEQVAGGNYGEYDEIASLIQSIEQKKHPGNPVEKLSAKDLKTWLQTNCNVTANFKILIDQPLLRKFELVNSASEYTVNGRVVSHNQVLKMVREKLK